MKVDNGTTSTGCQEGEVWKSIWNLDVPAIVKNFFWKANSNSLPVKLNLYKWKVLKEGLCPICQQVEKNVVHTLWNCLSTSDLFANYTPLHKWPNYFSNFQNLWHKLAITLDKEELKRVAVTLRNIWLHRNNFFFKKNFLNSNLLMQRAKEQLDFFHAANEGTKVAPTLPSWDKVCSKPPASNYYKTNWNVTMDIKEKRADFRVVIRDSDKKALACLSTSQAFHSQPIVAKCLTLWRTIKFCTHRTRSSKCRVRRRWATCYQWSTTRWAGLVVIQRTDWLRISN